MQNLTDKEKTQISEAVALIEKSFSWMQTDQGSTYWGEVVKNLIKLTESTVPLCPDCGQTLPSDESITEELEKRTKIRDAMNSIYDSFSWDDTVEGYDYWHNVAVNLNDLLRSLCAGCGQKRPDLGTTGF